MPTYEYHCEKCDQTYEVFQSMKDDHLTTCTQEGCDGKVRRLLGTGAGLIFKGSGFYITDYRSNNYKEGAKKESTTPSSGSASGEGAKSSVPAQPAAPAKPAAPSAPASGNA